MILKIGMFLAISLILGSCTPAQNPNSAANLGNMSMPPRGPMSSQGYIPGQVSSLDGKSSSQTILIEMDEIEKALQAYKLPLLDPTQSIFALDRMDLEDLEACKENLEAYLELGIEISQALEKGELVFPPNQDQKKSLLLRKINSARKIENSISYELEIRNKKTNKKKKSLPKTPIKSSESHPSHRSNVDEGSLERSKSTSPQKNFIERDLEEAANNGDPEVDEDTAIRAVGDEKRLPQLKKIIRSYCVSGTQKKDINQEENEYFETGEYQADIGEKMNESDDLIEKINKITGIQDSEKFSYKVDKVKLKNLSKDEINEVSSLVKESIKVNDFLYQAECRMNSGIPNTIINLYEPILQSLSSLNEALNELMVK